MITKQEVAKLKRILGQEFDYIIKKVLDGTKRDEVIAITSNCKGRVLAIIDKMDSK